MNGNWEESDSRVINLTEDDPDIFGIYINHVYTNQLATSEMDRDQLLQFDFAQVKEIVDKENSVLARVYLLGENCKILLQRLQSFPQSSNWQE